MALIEDLERTKIVAGVVRDRDGRLSLVRKAGTNVFMQPDGKPGPGEHSRDTLTREIEEELGCGIDRESAEHFLSAECRAAFEKNCVLEAGLYRVQLTGAPIASAEIEELIWLQPDEASDIRRVPLTADFVLPRIQRRR